MDFQVQLGDLANRLGRALGITGKINTIVRDPTLPVVLVADMSAPPYADAPAYFCDFLSQTGAAGQSAYWGFLAKAPRTVVTNVSLGASAAITGSVIIFRQVTGAVVAGGPFASTSLRGISQGVAIQATTSAAIGGQSSVSVATLVVPVNTTVNVVPNLSSGPIVLLPGDACIAQCATAAGLIQGMMTVAEYPR